MSDFFLLTVLAWVCMHRLIKWLCYHYTLPRHSILSTIHCYGPKLQISFFFRLPRSRGIVDGAFSLLLVFLFIFTHTATMPVAIELLTKYGATTDAEHSM